MKRVPAGQPGGGQFAPDPTKAAPPVVIPPVVKARWEQLGTTEMGRFAVEAAEAFAGREVTQRAIDTMAARLTATPADLECPITTDMEPLDALTRLDDAVVAGDTRALLAIARDPHVAAYHSYLTDEPAREVWGDDPQDMLTALHTSPDSYTRAQVARDPACPPHLLRVLAGDRDPSVARAAEEALPTTVRASVNDEDLHAAALAAGRGLDDMLRRMRIVEKRSA